MTSCFGSSDFQSGCTVWKAGSPPSLLILIAQGLIGFAGLIFLSLIFLSALRNSLTNCQKDAGQKDETNALEAVTIPNPFCGPT